MPKRRPSEISDAAILFIGPEGGWSERELQLAREHGCAFERLGIRRLRAETAAIVATALVAARAGEFLIDLTRSICTGGVLLPTNSLTITDNRTGKSYDVPINEETIRATDLRKIKVDDDDFGMMTYDPAFMNTAACRSAITFIDGDKGILEYRGYPIEQLAEKSTYLETA